jgi:predicted transcriptional regulator
MGTTTIQVDTKTRDRLARLKHVTGETYDSLLNKLLSLVPSEDDEGTFTDEFRIALLNARLDVAAGRLTPHDEVKRQLGL